jgi:ribonucleoside-diphosphate reductase alpha chain
MMMGKTDTAMTTSSDSEEAAVCPVGLSSDGPCKKTEPERPKELPGQTIKIRIGCGALYVTINRLGEKFYELFARAGKAGGCAASQCEAIGRLISLAWRKGATAEEVVKQLSGISCQLQDEEDSERADSCADGVAKAIKMVLGNEQ